MEAAHSPIGGSYKQKSSRATGFVASKVAVPNASISIAEHSWMCAAICSGSGNCELHDFAASRNRPVDCIRQFEAHFVGTGWQTDEDLLPLHQGWTYR